MIERFAGTTPAARPCRAPRAAGALLILLLLLAALAPAAHANNIGVRLWTVAPKYGGFVNLGVPPDTMYQDANEIVLHRIAVQSDVSSNYLTSAMFQVGYYRSGINIHLDNCAGSLGSGYMYFIEWRAYTGSNGAYSCALPAVAPTYPADCPGSVAHLSSGPWNAILGCGRTDLGDYSLNFSSGWNYIGGELNNAANTLANCSSTRGGYGYNGDAWNVYFHSDRGSPSQVLDPSNASTMTPTQNWTVPGVPTPFSISHASGC